MPNEFDLDEAVRQGIVTKDQAKQLQSVKGAATAGDTTVDQTDIEADDEAFRFISGFNDVFLALGVGMVLYGISASNLTATLSGLLGTIAVLWGLAEILTAWLRRAFPSMIIATAFVYQSMNLAGKFFIGSQLADTNFWDSIANSGPSTLPFALAGLAAAAIFYLRFRLPFAIFLIGLTIAFVIFSQSVAMLGKDVADVAIPILLVTGLGFFIVAMWFDQRDANRTNRLSDNAFWLHLIASPLIVHSIMWQTAIILGVGDPALWSNGSLGTAVGLHSIASTLAVVVLCIFIVLMTVALVIDRRAMLVSSLIYVSLAVSFYVTQQGAVLSAITFTPIIIGGGVILIGSAWRPLRKFIFAILPLSGIQSFVPPVKG